MRAGRGNPAGAKPHAVVADGVEAGRDRRPQSPGIGGASSLGAGAMRVRGLA